LIRDDPVQFADAVFNLLSDKKLRDNLVGQAYDLVRKMYDWNIILKKLILKLDSAKKFI